MHTWLLRTGVGLLLACGMSHAVKAAPAATGLLSGRIVFDRLQIDARGSTTRSNLSLTTPDGNAVGTFASAGEDVIEDSASWSPNGTMLAFERGQTQSDPADRFDIYSVDTRTGQKRQLSSGAGNFVTPVWGPRNRIAFVSRRQHSVCLSLIEVDGRQHDLYCPPRPADLMRPMWAKNGNSIFVHAGYYTDKLQFFWRSLAYRVDAATGAAVVIDDRVLGAPTHLEFAPDGSRGIYSNVYPYAAGMQLVNFTTGATVPLPTGYSPRWSNDGRHVAFTGEIYEVNPPDVLYYEPLYVMNANGTHVRRITKARVGNLAYTAADWSCDGVHLLINRRAYLDPSLTKRRFAMRIVNVETGALKVLPGGYAEAGAWFEH